MSARGADKRGKGGDRIKRSVQRVVNEDGEVERPSSGRLSPKKK